MLGAARRLRGHERDTASDVLVAHGGTAAAVAALAAPARRRRGPLVVWQRILPFPPGRPRGLARRAWRWVARRMDAAVALDAGLAAELDALGFRGPIWTIPNFRQPDRFVTVDRHDAGARLRAELGVARDVPLVGFVAHLIEQKRPERAIDALARLRALGAGAHLVVAGDGPLRGAVERAAAAAGLEDVVHLLGERRDVEYVLGGVDVTIVTSDAEGTPGVVIEALMTGCPVVSFPVGGVPALLEATGAGAVVASSDVDALAQKAAELLHSPDALRVMSERGRAHAEDYSSRTAGMIYSRSLEALLGGKRGDRFGAAAKRPSSPECDA